MPASEWVSSRYRDLLGVSLKLPGTPFRGDGLLVAAEKLWNYRVSGLVSEYEAGPEATILFASASEYVTEVVAMVEAGGSAFRRFLKKSSAGPV